VNDGLVDKGVNVLAVGSDGHTLYAGTSTGVYKSTLASSSVADPEEAGAALAGEFAPNPATGSTMLSLSLPRRSNVVAEIYSERGEKVATIQSGELPAGRHLLVWNAEGVANGTYWCRIQGNGLSESRRIVIAR
jgi:hypothetical protein